MRKVQILVTALFALVAVSALAATSASAAKWFSKSVEVANNTASTTEGTLILHHAGGLAGKILAECNGKFDGTVSTAGKDQITKVLDLLGNEITKTKQISCKVIEGKFGCEAGSTLTFFPDNLGGGKTWKTQLTEEGTSKFDEISEEGTGGAPGYETECNGVKVLCSGKDRSKWISNTTSGAEFEFKAELTNNCSDGGTGTVLGKGVAVGLEVI